MIEKLTILLLAAAITITPSPKENDFPLTTSELWQLCFILIAALVTSLSTEASKQADGEAVRPLRFFGSVGLGIVAGLAAPLMVGWVFEAALNIHTDWKASVGLSIIGAYFGRDMLQWLFSLVKMVKRLKIGLAEEESDATPIPPPAPSGGHRDPIPSAPDAAPSGGEGDVK